MSACYFCRGELNPLDPRVGQMMWGFECKGTGVNRKGGSDIVGRTKVDKFACATCLRKLQLGISPAQEALL